LKSNFARYGLLDAQVIFVEGYFSDTLLTARSRYLLGETEMTEQDHKRRSLVHQMC